MNTLTVFTPTYNRKHTIYRTFESLCRQTCNDFQWLIIDDGSTDDTRVWVESLGEKITTSGQCYDWMGRLVDKEDENHFMINSPNCRIEYVYKPNGGLYTGYNVAFGSIKTELCVCVDSDDFMPDNAVELIVNQWQELSVQQKQKVFGIAGLDYNTKNNMPIGGKFQTEKLIEWFPHLHHKGDCKFVFRTEIIRKVAPQIGYSGEKDFNPHYMQMQIIDKYPALIMNKNFCWVEYQIGADSMSQSIFKQYVRSPRSYAKYRLMELQVRHGNSLIRRFSLCAHYVSACIFAKDKDWLKNAQYKFLTVLALPLGLCYNVIIRCKTRN